LNFILEVHEKRFGATRKFMNIFNATIQNNGTGTGYNTNMPTLLRLVEHEALAMSNHN
jgi:hypothetical protein